MCNPGAMLSAGRTAATSAFEARERRAQQRNANARAAQQRYEAQQAERKRERVRRSKSLYTRKTLAPHGASNPTVSKTGE